MQDGKTPYFDEEKFSHDLDSTKSPIKVYKDALNSYQESMFEIFSESPNSPIEGLLKARSIFIDKIITRVWQQFVPSLNEAQYTLVAVGGYGRNELHPHSDVDILILLEQDLPKDTSSQIEDFIRFLWDIKLEIGSSVRTIAECAEEATNDITIATNIVESRLIYGSTSLFDELLELTSPQNIWPSRQFFAEKWREQKRRHMRFHDTGYNLEPNIKESPGGLRDIQMIGWVAKRHYGDRTLRDLEKRNFLSEQEFADLKQGQDFLWRVRFALHMITNRREDRLLFEHQREIAKLFNYKDNKEHIDKSHDDVQGNQFAVEIFMKQYYRTVMDLNRLNEMLLQHYQENILYDTGNLTPKKINNRFKATKGFIEIRNKNIFKKYPFAILELFLLIQEKAEIKGVRASTIRAVRDHIYLIDESFRNDIRCKSLFLEIFRQPAGLTHMLRKMNTYGVLAAYIPAFGKIVGQMQFDLFHVYTVDQHTLFVVRNIRRFFVDKFSHEFPLCSDIIRTIPKPELLYIAAVFHDIAKGRGGDHSVLGEKDAREFCELHGLSPYDTELVGWLVKSHLIMSSTAQHKDLSDPEVILNFARKVENNIKLDYLYLLTVADMRGTNDKIWNSWKDSLLKTLRRQTKLTLQRGLDSSVDQSDLISESKNLARAMLESYGFKNKDIEYQWQDFGDEYFLRYNSHEISRHMQHLLQNKNQETIIYIEANGLSGGTDVFIKTPIKRENFYKTTSALDKLGLNIVEAKVAKTRTEFSLNTFTVLESNGMRVQDDMRLNEIHESLMSTLTNTDAEKTKKAATPPRRIACFMQPTDISFSDDTQKQQTNVEIISTDRQGMLSIISYVFMKNRIKIRNAKIATLGAQVDDVFFIRDSDTNTCLDDEKKEIIKNEIIHQLDY